MNHERKEQLSARKHRRLRQIGSGSGCAQRDRSIVAVSKAKVAAKAAIVTHEVRNNGAAKSQQQQQRDMWQSPHNSGFAVQPLCQSYPEKNHL